jgi:hypothetical protein
MSTTTGASPPPFYIGKSVNSKGESIGNGLFVGRTYRAGEEITVLKRPLLGSLDTQYLHDTCANCYVWTEGAATSTRLYVSAATKVQTCAGCQRFRYCSKVTVTIAPSGARGSPSPRHVKKKPGTVGISTNARVYVRWQAKRSQRLF